MWHQRWLLVFVGLAVIGGGWWLFDALRADPSVREQRTSLEACAELAAHGPRKVAESRDRRFLGKVAEYTARCRGGEKAFARRDLPWLDWTNYWGTSDTDSKVPGFLERSRIGKLVENLDVLDQVEPGGRGVRGALVDLEYQRVELIKFNLFDNYTYPSFVEGRDGVGGRALKVWDEMRLPKDHPKYEQVGGDDEQQLCTGDLIRHRTLSGICNDTHNPLMGATGTLFARNVPFEETFPRLGRTELVRNRHGDRLGLLKPDPQLISRKLLTRAQSAPGACREGHGASNYGTEGDCDYIQAPFMNVLAAFWIQFMTHDWFSHLVEGRNRDETMRVGCDSEQAEAAGCRPDDRMERALIADDSEPGTFNHGDTKHLKRAPITTRNTVTAWWDASQIYGYDERSRQRVKRDPRDRAKLAMAAPDDGSVTSAGLGYLPLLEADSPMNPAWAGQAATAFPDNWTIGLSFYHNLFAREHNLFVDGFRQQAAKTPDADSGLRHPDRPDEAIRYRDVSDDELFEVARLVIAAEIAKIHTIEWTTQLLYNEPLYKAMNANWSGLLAKHEAASAVLDRIVTHGLGRSKDERKATDWYSVLAAGPGIFGLGNQVPAKGFVFRRLFQGEEDHWSLENPQHINGGINHFGSPFNFPEEFVSVYRLHPLVPDLLEFRRLAGDPNAISERIPVVESFRAKATEMMRDRGLADWGLTMGRQRMGALTLENHPQFLQNLRMPRLQSSTQTIDVAALDIIRDRERGIPRFNEFRRQYGLRQLTSFDDFIDRRLPAGSAERQRQEELARILREVYGQHRCDESKIITAAQRNVDKSAINDCLGHPDGSLVDNVEDIDNMVGWLAESVRPHGFAISETQFLVFILNASRRLFSDRFFTSSFRPEFYTHYGVRWVNDNGPGGKRWERGEPNGHRQEVSPLKRVLLRTVPELGDELRGVVNAFDPWARDRGAYYSLAWKPRPDAVTDPTFSRSAQ